MMAYLPRLSSSSCSTSVPHTDLIDGCCAISMAPQDAHTGHSGCTQGHARRRAAGRERHAVLQGRGEGGHF